MSMPLLDRGSSSPGKGTVSPPDTRLQQSKPASVHFDSPDTGRCSIETEAKTAVNPQSAVIQVEHPDRTQETTSGGSFFNNPYGTVLTTIAELGSTSTLLARTNESQLPNRARAEQEAAALKEFRKIVNGRRSESSSEETADLEKQSHENKQPAEKQVADESAVPGQNDGTCFSDHEPSPSLLGLSKGPDAGHSAALDHAPVTSWSGSSAPKLLFHIFPEYIQLGSFSQLEKPYHAQTDSTDTRPRANSSQSAVTTHAACQRLGISEASDDTVGTRYLPDGHLSDPSYLRRRSTTRPSASTQTSRKTVDECFLGKHNFSSGKQRHSEEATGKEPLESTINTIPREYEDASRASLFRSTTNRSSSVPRSKTRPPPTQACPDERNRRRSVSFQDTREPFQTGTSSTHTFRSAALESLLPIAAAQGIIIPYTLTPHHTTQKQATSIPATPFESSHSELSVLYLRGDVCRHRAAAYVAKGIEPQDSLLQMLEQMRVDGAVEIRERKDWCWRCRAEKKMEQVAGVAVPKSCCFFGTDKAGETERARLVDV